MSMEYRPPHLPPKACNIRTHNTFKSVWWLLFFVFVAGLSSVALTLSTVVWFTPSFIPNQMLVSSQKAAINNSSDDFDLSVLNNIRKRSWYVYDSRDKVEGQFYADTADKYQAIMFSSDGWAVAYIPDYNKTMQKYLEGVDYQGTLYTIDKVFLDPVSNLTYIKFEGAGYPFISFANWSDINENDTFWEVTNTKYTRHSIKKDLSLVEEVYKIWEPQLLYVIKDDFNVGNILVNDQGQMVGVIDKTGRVIYGWLINSQYASVVQNGAPDYQAVQWSGYMVNGYVSYGELTKKVSGFYVTSSDTKVTSSTVGVGDVVTKIENNRADIVDLSRQILLSSKDFTVTVYRDGQEFDISILKNKVLIK